jgi:hypothetical protein
MIFTAKWKLLVIIIVIVSVYSCVETFFPELVNKAGFLVVDAVITNESRSYDVYLTRSVSTLNSKVIVVKGAYVSVTDNSGKEFILQEVSAGHYITDSKKFLGEIGKKYFLYIKTSGGDEYRSDTCTMYGISTIDQIYYKRNTKYSENGIDESTGISIYIDGTVSDKNDCFLRWDFNEVWETEVPYPPEYAFSGTNIFTPVAEKNKYCWKNARSKDILIHSFQEQQNPVVKNKEIGFFITNQSDRFNVKYSVLVNQYTISRIEFEFWNKLKETNEEAGGIFEKQPYSISGNIKNLKNPEEVVLGYFQVESVYSKRLYIGPYEIGSLKLPLYPSTCELRTYKIGDTVETGRIRTLSEIYSYISRRDSVLVSPYYNDYGVITGMITTSRSCADCSVSGDPKKPGFWTK